MGTAQVLITSAGGSAALHCIHALRQQTDLAVRLIAGDSSAWSVGGRLADQAVILPPIASPEYIDQVLALCQRDQIQIVLPTLFPEISKFAAAQPRFAAAGIHLVIPPPKAVAQFQGKWGLYTFFRDHDLPIVPTYRTKPANLKFPCFIKPEAGSGSRHNLKIEDIEAFQFYVRRLKTPYVIQPYYEAPEFTVDVFADDACQIKAAVARERLRVKDGMAIAARTVPNDRVLPYLEKLVAVAQLSGAFNIQYFLTAHDELLFFDLNLRFSAGGLPLTIAAGANLPLMAIQQALGLPIEAVTDYPIGLTMLRYYSEMIF